jgi:hypothetical protein
MYETAREVAWFTVLMVGIIALVCISDIKEEKKNASTKNRN